MTTSKEQAGQEYAEKEWQHIRYNRPIAYEAFVSGTDWCEQHPSREMVEKLLIKMHDRILGKMCKDAKGMPPQNHRIFQHEVCTWMIESMHEILAQLVKEMEG